MNPPCPMKCRKAPPFESLYDSVVLVTFESVNRKYSVFKGLISYHSDFFRGAFRCGMEETETGEVKLPADEEAAFKMFRQWMHTGALHDDDEQPNLGNSAACTAFLQAYVFADAKGIPAMKNCMIDYLIDRRPVPIQSSNYVWKNTTEHDGLRKLYIDYFTMTRFKAGVFDGKHNVYPKDLLFLIMTRVLNPTYKPVIRTDREWENSKCQYHDHNDQTGKPLAAD